MKLKNETIYNSMDALNALIKKPLPVKTAFDVAKLAVKFNDQLKAIERTRMGLVQRFAKKDDEGNLEDIVKGSPEWPAFEAAFNELMAHEEEYVLTMIILPAKVDGKPLMIEPEILIPLADLIEVRET